MKKIIAFAFILQLISSILFNYSIYILTKEKLKLSKEALIGIIVGVVVSMISFVRWVSLVN